MITNKCAACAKPLEHKAPRCGNCKTRYCGRDCQKRHWKGGHKQICGQIKRGGGAEQYHADKKYKEAVVVAVKDCALDTKDQTCYICMEGAERRHTANEGLVRMCACRGTSGFAHLSCLVRQAQILVAEAEENNLDGKVKSQRWDRWYSCGLCEQRYHGVVWCAMGWACWKTYLGRPETDQVRSCAMNLLWNGLQNAQKYEDALEVVKADLSIQERNGVPRHVYLATLGNMAQVLDELRRPDEAIKIYEDIYAQKLSLYESSDIEVPTTSA
jgi:tetratricopeptide (TPR) repeat protein